MSTYLTPAIPLRIVDLPRDTVLVNLFTRDRGKVSAILRSGKKIIGKLPNYFSLLAELDVMIAPGKNFDIIAGVDRRQLFMDLQTNISKRLAVLSMLDIVNRVASEHEPDEDLYQFLLDWLKEVEINNIKDKELFLTLSLWQLLSKIGFTPNIDSCVKCHGELQGNLQYAADLYGFTCSNCKTSQTKSISKEASHLLQKLLQESSRAADLPHDFIEQNLANVLLHHVETILEFEVKGLRVYNEIINN